MPSVLALHAVGVGKRDDGVAGTVPGALHPRRRCACLRGVTALAAVMRGVYLCVGH